MFEDDEDELYADSAMGGLGAVPSASSADALAAWQQAQALVSEGIKSNLDLITAGRERIRQQRVGPSPAEQLLAVAAALGQPTRTGSFGETMGNLSGALLKQASAKRSAEEERQMLYDKYGMEIGNERLRMLTAAANQAGQTYSRTAAAEAARARAQAAAAKANRPIFRGTEKLNDGTIVAIYEDPTTGRLTNQPVGQGEQQLMPTELLAGGKPVFRMGSKLVLADGSPVTNVDKPERKLSPTEIALVDEKTKSLTAGKESLISLNRALELNPLALEGSLTGFRKSVGAFFSSDDPAYVATEDLDKTITGSALSQMKSVFGANPTEGERKILLELQGSSNQPRAVRERIFRNAMEAVQRRIESEAKTLADVRSGSFGRVQSATPSGGGTRLKYNPKTGKIE